MTTTESEGPREASGAQQPPEPPTMALRTYTCLRLAAVGVIVVLAASIAKEYRAAGDCLQGSISAYYYTSVQSVFVGALAALGLVMIALWGKTVWEESFLNLAGMLAPVVAFVPMKEPSPCGLTTTTGAEVTTQAQANKVVDASEPAVFNNMFAYFVVVGLILVILLAVGLWARFAAVPGQKTWSWVNRHPWGYWGPWVAAAALWLAGTYAFWTNDEWFYSNAHASSATVMFVFIVLVVANIGFQKFPRAAGRRPGWFWNRLTHTVDDETSVGWAWAYWGLAIVMSVGAAVLFLLPAELSANYHSHRTFWIEAWMIGWLAVFWALQTWDRRNDGAPKN